MFDEKDEDVVSDRIKLGRHTFRVSGVKVALRRAEIRRGPRGRFARRLKEILGRIHDVPEEPFLGVEVYEPARRPVAPKPVAGRALAPGKGEIEKRERDKADEKDSDDED